MSGTASGDIDAAKLRELIDRQEIYACLTRSCRGSDRMDRALFLSAFHDDAIADVGENACSPQQLYDWSSKTGSSVASQHHNLLNHSADIDGDVAHSETYYFYVAKVSDDTNWVVGGRYVDRFDRRDGGWKIALRYNLIEWSGTMPAGALPFAHVADLHDNGKPSRSKDDPSYRRPFINRRKVTDLG